MTVQTNAKLPYADTAIAKYLDKQIEALKGAKTQREIAAEIGYDKPNIISMFKRGEAKVPFDKIPSLAKALHVDPAHLLRLALEQYWPNIGQTFEQIFGRIATENEEEILLKKWRAATCNADPQPNDVVNAAVDRMITEISSNRGAASTRNTGSHP